MASGKEYEMLFKLNAQANSGFRGTFSQAQAEFARLGNEIQSLNKTQADISAYQKQSAAVDSTRAKIENLAKQHALLSRQIEEETGSTAALEREKLKLEQRMASTQGALERQQGRLDATSQRLEEAGVNTDNLAVESAQLAKEIEELSHQQEEAAQSAEEYGNSAVSAFQAAGEALAAAGIVAGIKQIGEAYVGTVQAAGEFGATMSNVEALSGTGRREMALLNAQAKELGATTKFTANQSGEAMGYMGMAGWNAQQMLAGMPGVLNLAAASGEDLAGVSDIVTDSLTGFKLTAADTGRFVDVLATASTKSNTNVSLLGESFKYVAPLCGTLGYEAEDAAIALGLMANSGIKGSQAGTTLKTAIANLAAPTEKQAAEMERLGISLTDTNGQMLPMLDMVGNLRGAFSGMSEAEQSAAASTIFGKEAMSGMLAIINASEADYQSLTQSIYNSAGAAEHMAGIKLDNLNGDLTLMQSAADGLSLTIGEEFMPQIRGLVQAGTGVIGFMDELIQEHPVLTKVIMGTAGAIGATTAAIVAYNGVKKAMSAFDLASLFTGPVGPILAVAGGIGLVTAGIIGAVEAANEGVPKVDELTRAAQEAAGAMEEISTDFDSTRMNIAATADVAGLYIDRLDELDSKTSLTSAESTEYHNILQLLCETVPDLAASIDLETDSINGGTEALRQQTEAWQKNAEAQAYQEAYRNLMSEYNEVMVEAAENSLRLTEAEHSLQAAEERRAEILRRQDELVQEAGGNVNNLAEEYYDLDHEMALLDEEIRTDEKTVRAYQEALDKSSAAAEEAEGKARGYADAMGDLSDGADDAAESLQEASDIGPELDEIMGKAVARARELTEAYQEAYGSALSSIQGQYSLWDEAAEVVAVSSDTIAAGIQSQLGYWQDYNANLASLRDRSADIQGLDDVIASFADGSAESVNAVAGMAAATDEDLAAIVQSWQELQSEHDEAAESISQLKTHFTEEMDALQSELEADIEAMDMGPEAYRQGMATIQGFIQGAADMEGEVQAVYGRIASIAERALRLSNTAAGQLGRLAAGSAEFRGYATGTESAAPGFAMVGENGPELVFFQGGEQVLNARETAALQARPAVSALPARTGGEPVVIQIHFQIEGNATQETVAQLREYGDEFAANVIRVLQENAEDTARRRYK